MPDTRVIKRYANRKMYDTSRSCYVTLEEVADMVRDGYDVRVIDNKTKDDLTEVTLTQALLDSERKQRGTVPLHGLRHLIASGNEFLHKRVAEPVIRVRSEAEKSIATWKDEANRTVLTWKTEAEKRVLHRAKDGQPGEVEGAGGPVLASLVEQTHKAVDDFQHRVDERIRHVVASLGPVGDGAEVAALRQRIEDLEGRLAALEAERKGGS
jgi:polyhydroxyalkanoate synthesis repressor PhaR